ncbi:CheR family methyltransferase [Desulfogranum japonicum]|uniref:CheR family methyltransferase n=1 Tax=Desulfogranum japonicum TaxID=231447 RepID=UPI0003F55F86|nr:protein-glutamate O-methyltransferase [Desulfogranum japonicum]
MQQDELSPRDFTRLSGFIYGQLGIKMPESKKCMLTGRLGKRLRVLELQNFREYCEYLFSDQGMQEELVHLIDAVTTNKTDFFREPGHFDYLVNTALPTMQILNRGRYRKKWRVWSAGCSTGEEPYTLAMVLSEYQEMMQGFSFEILATDVARRVLQVASRAVYPVERITPVSSRYRKKYFLRGKGSRNGEVRVNKQLRHRVSFGHLNFMDEDFGLPNMVDVIFCRNVIIYFDKQTQEKLMHKFYRYLNPGGYLFLGHSESLQGHQTPLIQVAPTVYRRSEQ